MRHNNDIDHITPIIYKLEKEHPSIIITILICNVMETFDDDYRIKFLRTLRIDIVHIFDCLTNPFIPINLYKKSVYISKVYRRFNPIRILINRLFVLPLMGLIENMIMNFNLDIFFQNLFNGVPNVIVFDQANNLFYKKLCEFSDENNIVTVAVPHGHNIYANEMIWSNSLQIKPAPPTNLGFDFQYVVFENSIIAERYKRQKIVKEKQILVLGSSRFCDEWVNKLDEILPKSTLPEPPSKILRIVILLTKMKFNIDRPELLRVIRFLSKFPDISIIVKMHPRGQRITESFSNNVKILKNEYQTSSLIDWADLVLFTGSSAMIDCLKKDVPILYMKYIHSNKLLSEDYFNSWEVHCRDDLRDFIWEFKRDKNTRTYTSKDRDIYCRETLEPAGKDVLGNYVSMLLKFL